MAKSYFLRNETEWEPTPSTLLTCGPPPCRSVPEPICADSSNSKTAACNGWDGPIIVLRFDQEVGENGCAGLVGVVEMAASRLSLTKS